MKFRLLARHVLSDQRLVEPGTEVGDDTPYPWRDMDGNPLPPTTQMEGLDDEARDAVRELHQNLYGLDPHWDRPMPSAEREAMEAQADEQSKLDESSEPVSDQQEVERDIGDEATAFPGPAAPAAPGRPLRPAPVAPTTGGVTTPSPGPATPKAPEPEDIRPTQPNKEQFPKDSGGGTKK